MSFSHQTSKICNDICNYSRQRRRLLHRLNINNFYLRCDRRLNGTLLCVIIVSDTCSPVLVAHLETLGGGACATLSIKAVCI